MKKRNLIICILLCFALTLTFFGCEKPAEEEPTPVKTDAPSESATPGPTATPVPDSQIATTYEELVENILREAQNVADFMRDNDFNYSEDLEINPAHNWAKLDETQAIDPSERLVSCDRFVGWVLYRVGFTDQPRDIGYLVYDFSEFCEAMGFRKITKVAMLKPGDIVFINPNKAHGYKPGHMFICASENLGHTTYLRYDAGSQERVKCIKGTELEPGKQPFKEVIGNFCYAYRPSVEKLITD